LGDNGLEKEVKVLTDPSDLYKSVLSGLTEITADIDPKQIHRIVLSTTLTTNAIAQKKTPTVGIIVSAGPGIDPQAYRTNDHYFTVSGSINHRGREIEPINPDEIHRIGQGLQQEGIRYVGVVSKFSIRNPAHELNIKALLDNSFEKIFMGHRISGSLNFARRIATTYLNAAVFPVHKKFYEAVQKSLKSKGLALPIRLLKADGGNMRFKNTVSNDSFGSGGQRNGCHCVRRKRRRYPGDGYRRHHHRYGHTNQTLPGIKSAGHSAGKL
jgi:N-methylhydantoinase A/oxoprolinase/acetone carboxylase beta subunit